MTVLNFKNIWSELQRVHVYTQLAHIGNKYNYAICKNKPIKIVHEFCD